MAKDKRKKKYFQGIEHLKQEYEISQEKTEIVGKKENHRYFKKDLLIFVILMLIFFGILAGLTILDKSGDYLTNISEKITSFLVKK